MRAVKGLFAVWFVAACTQDLRVLDRDPPQTEMSDGECMCEDPYLCAVDQCVNSTGVTEMALGSRHACRVRDGELECWGENRQSQLGLADAEEHLSPERVGDRSAWLQVAAAEEHTCAIESPGRLYCWGKNHLGQLGTKNTAPRNTPARVPGFEDFTRVFCGGSSSCALRRSDHLYCWGATAQLFAGPGDVQPGDMMPPDLVNTPIEVMQEMRWLDVSVGSGHVCGVTRQRALLCWGDNQDGQLGTGSTSTRRRLPMMVEPRNGWTKVAAGHHHTCGIRNRQLYCWGRGDSGELGLGPGMRRVLVPTRVGDEANWEQVATGMSHTCAINTDKFVYCWGRNAEAQLAQAPVDSIPTPTIVQPRTRFLDIAAGAQHSCARDIGQLMHCWGINDQGQLGLGDTMSRYTPTIVE